MGISSNLHDWLEVPHRFSFSAANKDLRKQNVPLNGLILSRRRLKWKLKLFPSAFIEFRWRTEQLWLEGAPKPLWAEAFQGLSTLVTLFQGFI